MKIDALTIEEQKSKPLAAIASDSDEIPMAQFMDHDEIQAAIRDSVREQLGLGRIPFRKASLPELRKCA